MRCSSPSAPPPSSTPVWAPGWPMLLAFHPVPPSLRCCDTPFWQRPQGAMSMTGRTRQHQHQQQGILLAIWGGRRCATAECMCGADCREGDHRGGGSGGLHVLPEPRGGERLHQLWGVPQYLHISVDPLSRPQFSAAIGSSSRLILAFKKGQRMGSQGA